jgi:ABC-2 type transport system ATP-binding protein
VSDPAIRVRGLTRRFGTVTAVDDLDLDVPRGSAFGLIGPNGAGKTTTMLCLATLLRPDRGEVSVFGHDPRSNQREVRALVGWMPDFFGVYDDLTCREYLDFFAAAYRVDATIRRRRVDDLLELVGLEHKAGTDVSGLSRGMQQRLGLARTLVHDPQLLILDEPASGLDPRARVEVRAILQELCRQGRTLLISSHILSELAALCDRIGIIEQGRMLAQGTPAEIESRAAGTMTVDVAVLHNGGSDGDAIQRALARAGDFGVVSAMATDNGIRVVLDGDADRAAALLRALIESGVDVTAFTPRRDDLEQVFLSVTDGLTA